MKMVEMVKREVTTRIIINYLNKSEYKCLLPKIFHSSKNTIKITETSGTKTLFEQDEIDVFSVMKADLNFIPPKGKISEERP